jgi:hypothetical protein
MYFYMNKQSGRLYEGASPWITGLKGKIDSLEMVSKRIYS